jgi:hypothetical protein
MIQQRVQVTTRLLVLTEADDIRRLQGYRKGIVDHYVIEYDRSAGWMKTAAYLFAAALVASCLYFYGAAK